MTIFENLYSYHHIWVSKYLFFFNSNKFLSICSWTRLYKLTISFLSDFWKFWWGGEKKKCVGLIIDECRFISLILTSAIRSFIVSKYLGTSSRSPNTLILSNECLYTILQVFLIYVHLCPCYWMRYLLRQYGYEKVRFFSFCNKAWHHSLQKIIH